MNIEDQVQTCSLNCQSFAGPRRMLADLRELIAALDRRVPQPHRDAERHIAIESAQLRHDAHARIASIERLLAR